MILLLESYISPRERWENAGVCLCISMVVLTKWETAPVWNTLVAIKIAVRQQLIYVSTTISKQK
jgi:hypothetical protein